MSRNYNKSAMRVKDYHDKYGLRHDPVRSRKETGFVGDDIWCVCCNDETWVSEEEFEFLWTNGHILDDHIWTPIYTGKDDGVEYTGGSMRVIDVSELCVTCHPERFGDALSHNRLDTEQIRRLKRDKLVQKIQLICKQIDRLNKMDINDGLKRYHSTGL